MGNFHETITSVEWWNAKWFVSAQESFQKDLERAFGVLMSQWALWASPCRLREMHFIGKDMNSAIILHIMIFEICRKEYDSVLWSRIISIVGLQAVADVEGN